MIDKDLLWDTVNAIIKRGNNIEISMNQAGEVKLFEIKKNRHEITQRIPNRQTILK